MKDKIKLKKGEYVDVDWQPRDWNELLGKVIEVVGESRSKEKMKQINGVKLEEILHELRCTGKQIYALAIENLLEDIEPKLKPVDK